MQEQITHAGVGPGQAADLWTATYVLLGLEYEAVVVDRLLQGVRQMKESVTYQAILREGEEKGREEGRALEAHAIILRLGEKRFGAPDAAIREALAAVTDLVRLETLSERILEVESWQELLA